MQLLLKISRVFVGNISESCRCSQYFLPCRLGDALPRGIVENERNRGTRDVRLSCHILCGDPILCHSPHPGAGYPLTEPAMRPRMK